MWRVTFLPIKLRNLKKIKDLIVTNDFIEIYAYGVLPSQIYILYYIVSGGQCGTVSLYPIDNLPYYPYT